MYRAGRPCSENCAKELNLEGTRDSIAIIISSSKKNEVMREMYTDVMSSMVSSIHTETTPDITGRERRKPWQTSGVAQCEEPSFRMISKQLIFVMCTALRYASIYKICFFACFSTIGKLGTGIYLGSSINDRYTRTIFLEITNWFTVLATCGSKRCMQRFSLNYSQIDWSRIMCLKE